MCGILAVLGAADASARTRAKVLECTARLRHRGPDWSGVHTFGNNFLAHERLAVIDPASGHQPLRNEDGSIVVAVNGEIYNYQQLRDELQDCHTFNTGSDCEVIAHLYEDVGEAAVQKLDGIFAFVLLNTKDGSYIAARDPIGVCPLYIGWGRDGSMWLASEMKALKDDCERFETFPPGHIYSSKDHTLRRWYNPAWYDEHIPSAPYDPLALHAAFEKAVVKRLMTDVPFGVLLSGGLDSSLVAAVAQRHLASTEAGKHTPMFLLSRKIKALGVKMVLSGEGSDEVFGGYLYFHKAPSKEKFHVETCHKLKALHMYDCLRANKATSAWGLEARVPFLDKEFLDVAMSIDPQYKMIRKEDGRIEKWVIRRAFDDEEKPYLPKVTRTYLSCAVPTRAYPLSLPPSPPIPPTLTAQPPLPIYPRPFSPLQYQSQQHHAQHLQSFTPHLPPLPYHRLINPSLPLSNHPTSPSPPPPPRPPLTFPLSPLIFPTHSLLNFPTHSLLNFPTHSLLNFPTHSLLISPTHSLLISPTHSLLISPTHSLLIFPTHSLEASHSACHSLISPTHSLLSSPPPTHSSSPPPTHSSSPSLTHLQHLIRLLSLLLTPSSPPPTHSSSPSLTHLQHLIRLLSCLIWHVVATCDVTAAHVSRFSASHALISPTHSLLISLTHSLAASHSPPQLSDWHVVATCDVTAAHVSRFSASHALISPTHSLLISLTHSLAASHSPPQLSDLACGSYM
ncbi:unnamed protein product [Closterium sp. Naga37s-1]|nr:unnamed protein product [Closterium sp. Naga37s-1]